MSARDPVLRPDRSAYPSARLAPLLAGLLAAGLWWIFATIPKSPALELAAPPGVFDFFAYYLPNADYAFRRLGAGDLPLWNPHQGFGMPLLATLQTGVLYPPNWLHLLLPTQLAFAVLAALHVGIAAGLAAALACALGATGLGATTAGVLFGGSGWILGSLWSPPTLYCAAWLPGVLLAVNAVVDRPRLPSIAALAGAVAMQGLSGWPYVLLMSGMAGALFGGSALVERALRERRLPVTSVLGLAAGALAGGALAAPQLLPASELLALSSRALGVLAPAQTVLVPAQHDPGLFVSQLLTRGWNDAVPGVLALPLAAAALGMRGPHRVRLALLVAVGVFGLLLSFPLHVPLYGWLRHLPLVGDFRFPFRYRLLTDLSLAVAAGVGVTRLQALLPSRARSQLAAGALVGLLVVVAQAIVVLRATAPFPREATWPAAPETARVVADLAARTSDGSRIHWQLGAETSWHYKVGERRGLRVTHDLEPLTPATTARYLNYFETGIAGTLDPDALVSSSRAAAASDPASVPFFGHVGVPADGSRARLLDLASVRYVLSQSTAAWLDQRYRRVEGAGRRPALFENPGALPRTYRASHAEPEPPAPEVALARLARDDLDPRANVLLDVVPPALRDPPSEETESDAGFASFERDEPEHQVIRTRGARAAALVITDAYFPGWEATVDGVPAPVQRANTAFRAVAVPAGEHVVELRYRPRPFRVGVGLALATLAVGAVCVSARVWQLRRTRVDESRGTVA